MKILRLTRHEAGPEQRAELNRIFGAEAEIVEISKTVANAEEVKQLVAEHQADVLEAVLPLNIVADLLNPRTGLQAPVIRAITKRELREDGSAVFHFSHYEKLVKVEIVTERL